MREDTRVLAQAISDLVLTALKERSTAPPRRYEYYLSVDPRIAQRAAARARVAVVLVAVGVSWASSLQTPTYEASAHVWVDVEQRDRSTNPAGGGEEILTDLQGLNALIQTVTYATDSSPVAEEAIQRLEFWD